MGTAILKDNPSAMNPEEIEACLNCKKPRCTDCFAKAYKGSQKQKKFIDAKLLTELYNAGVTKVVIARRLGIHMDTLNKRLAQFGIPSDYPRPFLRKETFTALDFETRTHITWGGELLI